MMTAFWRINAVRKIDAVVRTAGLPLTLVALMALFASAIVLVMLDTCNDEQLQLDRERAYFSRLVDDGYLPGTISLEQAAMIESQD